MIATEGANGEAAEALPPGRVGRPTRQLLGRCHALLHLTIKGLLMVVIVTQSRVDLGQRQVWMLPVEFICAPPIGNVIQGDLPHLHLRLVNPDNTGGIAEEMSNRLGRQHGKRIVGTGWTVKGANKAAGPPGEGGLRRGRGERLGARGEGR